MTVLAARALRSREPTERGELLTFTGGADVERRLREAVAREAECCPFLAFDLQRDGTALRLTVTGPPDARPVIAALFRPAVRDGS